MFDNDKQRSLIILITINHNYNNVLVVCYLIDGGSLKGVQTRRIQHIQQKTHNLKRIPAIPF